MNAPKCTEYDYINFLVAAQQVFSAVEASRSHPEGEQQEAHDAYTGLLQRLPLLETAHERGFQPGLVAFDSGYSSLENLKLVRDFTWDWLTRLKSNRQVSLTVGQQQAVSELDIPPNGLVVHLRGYGMVKVFRTVDTYGNADYWATSRLTMTDADRELFANRA